MYNKFWSQENLNIYYKSRPSAKLVVLTVKKAHKYRAFLCLYDIIIIEVIIMLGENKTEQVIFFSMEDFVPKDHLLRKIKSTIDFS